MDIKLPSSTNTLPLWERHIEFLRIAKKKMVFIKVVVTENTSKKDIIEARDIIESVDKDIPLILQPVSPIEDTNFARRKRRLLDYCTLSEEKLSNIRIIPQIHKFVDMR
jgi:organic radical activating enzyme